MTSPTYRTNKKQLIEIMPSAASLVVIAGNGLVSRSADTSFTFRQDSNFLYLCGVSKPNSALFIDVSNLKTYLVKPNQSKVETIFDDPFESGINFKQSSVDEIISHNKALEILGAKSKEGDVYFNLPPKSKSHGLYSNPHRRYWQGIFARNGVEAKDVRPYLGKIRMIKKSYEVERIQEAVNITKNVLSNIELASYVGMNELDIANKITYDFLKESTSNAYAPIVAIDSNAAVLHHLPDNTCNLKSDSNILFDVGAEYDGYAADISRTVYLGKNVHIDRLIKDLKDAQKHIIDHVKPGVNWRELHKIAVDSLAEVAKSSNLFSDQPINELFPHSIGHFIGLDVHDAGDYSEQLSENMVITIEPGLYSKKHGIGIRLEDDILITKTGSKIL